MPRFERWTSHLLDGIDVTAASGSKAIHYSRVQLKGGYQNYFIFAEKGPRVTAPLWARLGSAAVRRDQPEQF